MGNTASVSSSLTGHVGPVNCIACFPSGTHVVTGDGEGTIRIFNLSTNSCESTLSKHSGSLKGFVVLDNDTFLSYGKDNTVRMWSRSQANTTHQKIKLRHEIFSVARLSESVFLVTDGSNSIRGFSRVGQGLERVAHKEIPQLSGIQGVYKVFVDRTLIAVCMRDNSVKLYDRFNFFYLGTLTGHKEKVEVVCMDDTYIVTSSRDLTVRLFYIADFSSHGFFNVTMRASRMAHIALASGFLLMAGDLTVHVFSPHDYKAQMSIRFDTDLYSTLVLNDGRIARGIENQVDIYSPAPDVMQLLKGRNHALVPLNQHKRLAATQIFPIQKACISCLRGEISPTEACDLYIKASTCAVTSMEWVSAHQLLMLAARDSETYRKTSFNGNIAYWFENLYLQCKQLELTHEKDLLVVKRCLFEASAVGVIEGIEPVLVALHLTNETKVEISELKQAAVKTFQKVLDVEGRVDAAERRLNLLRKHFDNYRKRQRNSQLVAIGLQLVPILGGILQNASQAAVEGISDLFTDTSALESGGAMKEFVDGCTEEEADIKEKEKEGEDKPSFGDQIIQNTYRAISPDTVKDLSKEQVKQLGQLAGAFGMSLSTLQEMFTQRGELDERDELEKDISLEQRLLQERTNSPNQLNQKGFKDEKLQDPEPMLMKKKLVDVLKKLLPSEGEVKRHPQLQGVKVEGVSLQNEMNHEHSEGAIIDLDQFKNVEVNRETVQHMSGTKIAECLAAFLVGFDNAKREVFRKMCTRIVETLEEEELSASLLVDRGVLCVEEVHQVLLKGFNKEPSVQMTLGKKALLSKFLNKLQ